jgi:hypothetical protein
VREFVTQKIGAQYLPQLLGVWNSAQEIDVEALPAPCVLKCNHDSGSAVLFWGKENIVRKNQEHITPKEMIAYLEERLAYNYYEFSREWAYKNMQHKIIAEELLAGENGEVPNDYKVHCFNGKPYYIEVILDRFGDANNEDDAVFYDTDWNVYEVYGHSRTSQRIPIPPQLADLLSLAATLSAEFPYVRIDFYIAKGGRIYFSEYCFYHSGGYEKFQPSSWDMELGKLMELPSTQETR